MCVCVCVCVCACVEGESLGVWGTISFFFSLRVLESLISWKEIVFITSGLALQAIHITLQDDITREFKLQKWLRKY